MAVKTKSLIWAAIILSTALILVGTGINDGAAFGVIGGLSGAAWGSINSNAACGRSCFQ